MPKRLRVCVSFGPCAIRYFPVTFSPQSSSSRSARAATTTG
ncbi:hypothetical protein DB32_004717 [Sandaracinus amylolyticus]|uniref:Uncharacterized protein n=1 Tax=Sandaracinus amylolyticus TaxID=927083 RepID=A0A0F6W4W6_9BACT|nr:hypothetical protein DB32_004717 [Sandaracinus amylolyticus]